MGLCEGILGVKADYEGLRVEPCLPADWDGAELTRRFHGADYHIVIRNLENKEHGAPVITVDGIGIDGTLLPNFRDGQLHQIEVVV